MRGIEDVAGIQVLRGNGTPTLAIVTDIRDGLAVVWEVCRRWELQHSYSYDDEPNLLLPCKCHHY